MEYENARKKENEFEPVELNILQLMSEGKSSSEIGKNLFKSKRAIEFYKERIKEKTGIKGIVNQVIYAIKKNLIRI
jgi:DNA-binding CsgD family transcriptional regulator